MLADLPAPRLHDTIPDFHHTPKRFAALEKAIEADAANRARLAKAEIEFAMKNQAMASVLLDANLPERVTHNDCKLNNVMLDDATGEGICVIDLDTVMPGLALYDFGDMVRTTTSPAKEDERDLAKVNMQLPMFEALARGYLSSAAEFLTTDEKKFLVVSGKVITFEIGLRFLADFLAGDVYFKVHRENHNLDRCRTQFKLVESIAAAGRTDEQIGGNNLKSAGRARKKSERAWISVPIQNMRILVTGGAGFIGSHIVEHFQGKAHVRVLDNLRSGFKKNLAGLEHEFIEASILDRAAVRRAMQVWIMFFTSRR